jgi:DNA polymerase type B, organellar and viral
MDGAAGSIGSRHYGRKRLARTGTIREPERHDIFVRAHTSVRSESDYHRGSPKWPRHCLIFDTETALDTAQQLNFGAFRRCKLVGSKYVCVAEGIFHRDELTKAEANALQRYKDDPPTFPQIEYFPAETQLSLKDRSTFIRKIFWKSVRNGELIVCFNSPFDLSRLAVWSKAGKTGNWSLALSQLWKNPKTGREVPNPKRPRIVIDAQNSKMAFIKLGSILHPNEWPEGRFLDLRTLGWAIRNVSYSLKSACKNFDVRGKHRHKPTGQITPEEIEYCRGDVAASHRLLNAMMEEFNRNPLDLHPDKAYSPASVAKAYLEEMNIKKPRQHFRAPNRILGIAMQSYYGGRAECRIRKTPVPVIHTDFTSQYPTVNALMGNWNVLTSSSVRFRNCTARARQLLGRTQVDDTFDPALWKQMNFFALVKPQSDLLPIRTVYGETGRTKNIGLNYLSSETPIWYAAPDLIASKILNGKAPHIVRAIELIPSGRQNRLKSTNLGGMVKIEPAKQDFYREVIQQRAAHKKTDEGLSNFLKVLANSGSYGLFVEVNTETRKKEREINYFSGETGGKVDSNYTEKPGKWYFPPLASLITSGGRLLLAMLEKSVEDKGGSYLFCDTDSLCIVGTKNGSFVPCPGGKIRRHGVAGFNALSLREIRQIADKFKRLNPYDPSLVSEILKIEDVNFEHSEPKKPFRQLYGYSISAKRYALYTRSGNYIQIEKASGHGLGYLLAPKERRKDEDEETPQWVIEAWRFLLQKELKLRADEPRWLDLPAMMRMVVTTPNVFKHQRPEWLRPFNFFLFPIVSPLVGQPVGYENSKFVFITPYESDRRKWKSLTGVNLGDGKDFQIAMRPTANQDKVIPDSFRKVLHSYLSKPEVKSLAPDGTPCTGETRGLLLRAEITAGNLIPVGKETDRHWEHGEDPSMVDPQSYVYEKQGNMVVADASDRKSWSAIGVRRLMRESKLSQAPVSNTIKGKPVRRQTLSVIRQAADKIKA